MGRRSQQKGRRASPRTLLIVTNGALTEQLYLKEVVQRLRVEGVRATVQFVNGEPATMLRDLRRPRGGTDGYDEVWVVFDEDGKDRQPVFDQCRKLSSSTPQWHAVVSRPCFETWLVAHYTNVRRYPESKDAQRHLATLVPSGTPPKVLPKDFPFGAVEEAERRCRLPGDALEALGSMPPTPGSGMPHLIHSLRGGTAPRRP